MAYEEFLRGLLPPWLRGPTAEKLTTTISFMVDAFLSAAKAAARAHLLSDCPPDAVEHHIRARLLERIPDEPIEALRARGLQAWTFWAELHRRRTVSAPSGLEAMLRTHLGLSGVWVFDQANDDWQAGAIADGDDANADNASRQAIVIEQPHQWERPICGAVVCGPQTLVGITMTRSELSRIRGLYRKHRPANMIGLDIWVLFDSTTAEDILGNHDATSAYDGEAIRLPLLCSLAGYQGNGAHHHMQCGDLCIVGREFT